MALALNHVSYYLDILHFIKQTKKQSIWSVMLLWEDVTIYPTLSAVHPVLFFFWFIHPTAYLLLDLFYQHIVHFTNVFKYFFPEPVLWTRARDYFCVVLCLFTNGGWLFLKFNPRSTFVDTVYPSHDNYACNKILQINSYVDCQIDNTILSTNVSWNGWEGVKGGLHTGSDLDTVQVAPLCVVLDFKCSSYIFVL